MLCLPAGPGNPGRTTWRGRRENSVHRWSIWEFPGWTRDSMAGGHVTPLHSMSDWGHWSCWGVPQSSEGQLHEDQAPRQRQPPRGASWIWTLLFLLWVDIFIFFPLYFKQNKISLCCVVLAVKFSLHLELFQGVNPRYSHGAHKGQNWDKWCHIPRQSGQCALKPFRTIPEREKTLNPSGAIPECRRRGHTWR